MSSVISPNMDLTIPTVGVEPGPQYAQDINDSLNRIDVHDHSPGLGVQVTPTGLNINATLPLNDNKLTAAAALEFTAQTSLADTSALYSIGSDLYYNDAVGNVIRITQSGSVVTGGGNITGLVAPASATYAAGKFTWQSNVNTPANMDGSSVTIREQVSNGKGVTLSAPIALGANYTLTMPGAVPSAAGSLLLTNTSGVQSYLVPTGSSGLPLVSSGTNTSYAQLSTAGIASNAVTPAKLSAPNYSQVNWSTTSTSSTSPVAVTGASTSIIASGLRPVQVTFASTAGTVNVTDGTGRPYGIIRVDVGATSFFTDYAAASGTALATALTARGPFPSAITVFPTAGSISVAVYFYVVNASGASCSMQVIGGTLTVLEL